MMFQCEATFQVHDSFILGAALLQLTSLATIDLNGNEIGLLPLEFVHLPNLVNEAFAL